MSSIQDRINELAATAVPTDKGHRLDLRLYIYPGHSGYYASPDGVRGPGGPRSDDLELIAELAQVVRRVRQAQAKAVKKVAS